MDDELEILLNDAFIFPRRKARPRPIRRESIGPVRDACRLPQAETETPSERRGEDAKQSIHPYESWIDNPTLSPGKDERVKATASGESPSGTQSSIR